MLGYYLDSGHGVCSRTWKVLRRLGYSMRFTVLWRVHVTTSTAFNGSAISSTGMM